MKTIALTVVLLSLPFSASAAKFGDAGRPAELPQDANGRDSVHCEMVRTVYADAPQQVCLTAGQRMTAAANAEAAASQKAVSDRAIHDARAAAGISQDASSR